MIDHLAKILRTAESQVMGCQALTKLDAEWTIDKAYQVQNLNTQFAVDSGRKIIGRKIGLTSKVVQKQLGVDQPDFGMLYADMELFSGGSLKRSSLIFPKAETELAFLVGQDILETPNSIEELSNFIEGASLALEIVDSRIADWKINIYDTIADNASSGRFIIGNELKPLKEIDLELSGMALYRNELLESNGACAACLGNPLNAVMWLVETMIKYERPLLKGEWILSGALGPMVNVNAGDNFEAQLYGFEPITMNVI